MIKSIVLLALALFPLCGSAADRSATLPTSAALVCAGGPSVHAASEKLNLKLADSEGVKVHHAGVTLLVARPFNVSSPSITEGECTCPDGKKDGCGCDEKAHACVTVSSVGVTPVVEH